MKKAIFLTSCAAALSALAPTGLGAVLLQFQFSNTATGLSADVVDANVTASPVAMSASIAGTIETPTPTYSTQPVLRVFPLGTTASAAITNNSYFQFAIEPNANHELDLTSIAFKAARGGGGTPRGWALRSSLDSYAANLGTSDIGTVRATWTDYTVTLPAEFQDLDQQVTFRMYAYSPATGSTIEFDDVTIDGAATLVPEPGIAGLAFVAAAGLLRRRRAVPATGVTRPATK